LFKSIAKEPIIKLGNVPNSDIEAADDFAFVPEKETSSKSVASDLRSAFEDF
jgi:hypothetical protein